MLHMAFVRSWWLPSWWPPSASQLDTHGLPIVGGIFLPLSATTFAWALLQARDARALCSKSPYDRANNACKKSVEVDNGVREGETALTAWEAGELKEFDEARVELSSLVHETCKDEAMGHEGILRLASTLDIARRFKERHAKHVKNIEELDSVINAGTALAIAQLIKEIPNALERTKAACDVQYRDGARIEKLFTCLDELVPRVPWWRRFGSSFTESDETEIHRQALLAWKQEQRCLRRQQVRNLLWEGRSEISLAALATGLSLVRGGLDPLRARFEADVGEAVFTQDATTFWISARAMVYVYLIRASISHVIEVCKAVGLETFKDNLKSRLYSSILSQDIEWFDTQDLRSVNMVMHTMEFNFAQLLDMPGRCAELAATLIAGTVALLKTEDKDWHNFRLMAKLWLLGKAPIVVHMIGLALPPFVEACFLGSSQVQRQWTRKQEILNPRTFRTVRAFTLEPDELRKNDASIMIERKCRLHSSLVLIFIMPFQQLFEVGTRLYSSWWSHSIVLKGMLTEGETFSLSAYADRLVESCVTLVPAVVNLMNLDYLYRAVEVISMVPKIGLEGGESPRLETIKFDVEFKNVHFRYPTRPETLILDNCCFRVEEGTVVGLMGESGVGKSTCMSLLERFYDVTHGQILLGGRDIRTYNPIWLRNHIAIVSQEPVLINDSIRANLSYGCTETVTDERLWEACDHAHISAALKDKTRFPDGLRTYVGSGAVQLSGGEKQRIAIARAVLRDPKILLLDEATSALDYENEELVQQALEKLMRGRTTLIIAHRLSTIRKADKIVCMVNGQVGEEGTHEVLVASGQLYACLIEKQREMVLENVGFNDSGLKHRLANVKAAFQQQDPCAEEMLGAILVDLQEKVHVSTDVNSTSQEQSSGSTAPAPLGPRTGWLA